MGPGNFGPQERKEWTKNLLIFLAPLGLLYFGSVAALLQTPGHVISLNDFVPSSFALGGMALYVVNAITDFLRKLESDNR